MIIICIGPDCAGKSTMVTKVAEELHFESVRFKQPLTDTDKRESVEALQKALESGRNVIYDRHPVLDDIVYSPIISGTPSYFTNVLEFEGVLRRCKIFFITASEEVLAKRMKERGDEYVSTRELDVILSNYSILLSRLAEKGVDVEVVKTDKRSIESACGYLKARIFECRDERKEPRMAHIVPVGSLGATRENQYHMCLAQNCADRAYKDFYKERAREGKYVLLDNGAAEGCTISAEALYNLACEINATEVVLPDFLKDGCETLRATKRACEFFKKQSRQFKLMGVPQGKDVEEWLLCAKTMLDACDIDTIGVPKWLESTENPYGRYFVVALLERVLVETNRPDVEVHLLGCNTSPGIIRQIFDYFPLVRGCDSAYAFLCAASFEPISETTGRPLGKIDFLSREKCEGLSKALEQLDSIVLKGGNKIHYSWQEVKQCTE